MGSSAATPNPNKPATNKKQTPALPMPLKKEDVWYLALEGGGGRGVTYLGAIEALEDLHVLPLNRPSIKNQILGISGASAGAITALLLALGYSSVDIKKLLEDTSKINAFFDGPMCGIYRYINSDGKETVGYDPGVDEGVIFKRKDGIGNVIPLAISGLLANGKVPEDPISKAIALDVKGYLYNLFFDRGLFPGFAVTEFFRNLLRDYFERQPKQGSLAVKGDPGMIGFKQFYDKTKINLVFTGVNTTSKKVMTFSKEWTPNFSIAIAVSISMNLPFLFKPVQVSAESLGLFGGQGFYVDGGLQNNLPLHAFDDLESNPNRNVSTGTHGLHPKMLGLRLTPGFPPRMSPNVPGSMTPLDQPFFQILSTYFQDIFDSLMTPSEEGQIRSPQERIQTIQLLTGDLSLAEFTPPQSKSEWPVKNAKEVVAKYFAQKPK